MNHKHKKKNTGRLLDSYFYFILFSIAIMYLLFIYNYTVSKSSAERIDVGKVERANKKAIREKIVLQHNMESILLEGLPPLAPTFDNDGTVRFSISSLFEKPKGFVTIDDILSENNGNETGNIVIFSATGGVDLSQILEFMTKNDNNIEYFGNIFPEEFNERKNKNDISSFLQFDAHDSVDLQRQVLMHIRFIAAESEKSSTPPRRLFTVSWPFPVQGISVGWLMRQLRDSGECTHLILLTRNPTRLLIAEQWRSRRATVGNGAGTTSASASARLPCESQRYVYGVSGQQTVQTALSQYRAVREAVFATGMQTIGISYEFNVLSDPTDTHALLSQFLGGVHFETEAPVVDDGLMTSTDKRTADEWVSSCRLSVLLFNHKDLVCALTKWDQNRHRSHLRAPDATALSWMASDIEEPLSFEQMIETWSLLDKEAVANQDRLDPVESCTDEELTGMDNGVGPLLYRILGSDP